MSKKCYRFFGGLLNTQEKWLNKMSEKGYRLVRTGKLLYEFEKCKPDEVTYCVEFIGEKSKESSIDYANFLEDMGYKVFFKNINLNYSVGKVRWRPWAERGGRIATNTTTFNREILIVEKANDGKPFELHTSYDDKEKYYRNLRNPWLFLLLMFALFAVTKQSIIFGTHVLLDHVPGLAPTSLLLLEQIRTVDRRRLRGYIGQINKKKMKEIDAALAISVGLRSLA